MFCFDLADLYEFVYNIIMSCSLVSMLQLFFLLCYEHGNKATSFVFHFS